MMKIPEQTIKELINQLILLGDDREELFFWVDLYPHLDRDEQGELKENLENELKKLSSLSLSQKNK